MSLDKGVNRRASMARPTVQRDYLSTVKSLESFTIPARWVISQTAVR